MCRPPEEEVTRISGCQLQPLKRPFSLPPFEQFTVLRFAYTNTKGGRESGGRERKTNIQREREREREGGQAGRHRQTDKQTDGDRDRLTNRQKSRKRERERAGGR